MGFKLWLNHLREQYNYENGIWEAYNLAASTSTTKDVLFSALRRKFLKFITVETTYACKIMYLHLSGKPTYVGFKYIHYAWFYFWKPDEFINVRGNKLTLTSSQAREVREFFEDRL